MTRVGTKDVDRLVPGDLVWINSSGRRVVHRERLIPLCWQEERWPAHVVFFADGTHKAYDRGYTRVLVVIAAQTAHNAGYARVLERP